MPIFRLSSGPIWANWMVQKWREGPESKNMQKSETTIRILWIVGEEWLRYSVHPLGLDDFCQDGGLNLRGYKYPMSEWLHYP